MDLKFTPGLWFVAGGRMQDAGLPLVACGVHKPGDW